MKIYAIYESYHGKDDKIVAYVSSKKKASAWIQSLEGLKNSAMLDVAGNNYGWRATWKATEEALQPKNITKFFFYVGVAHSYCVKEQTVL